MRILAVVYACEPERGSEPGVGWRLVHELALEHEVVAVTRANNRSAIEAAQRHGSLPPVEFVYCDAPRGLQLLKRGNRGVYRYQAVWQILAFAKALRLHRQRPFDLVHGITFSAAWFPSLFALFPAPFLWGPLACNEPVPRKLASKLCSRAGRWRNGFRRWLNGPLSSLNPMIQLGRWRARRLLVVNPYVASSMGVAHRHKTRIFPAIGAEAVAAGRAGIDEQGQAPLNVTMVGRMIGLKGYPLAIQAIADPRIAGRVRLTCIGDGPRRRQLERLAEELGVADSIRFRGNLCHGETLARIGAADLLLFPAFDAGGMVMVEAMARAVPVVALDSGGASLALRDGAGLLIPVGEFEAVVDGIVTAIAELVADPELRRRIGVAGNRRFAEEYEWERKGSRLREILREIESESVQAAVSPS